MARKFLLVPSEAYRELLALSDSSEVLSGARGHMDRILRTKKLNASTKNALYNQQQRGFLKLRKEILERPVKVEVAGGPKLLVGTQGVGAYTDAESEEPDEEVLQSIPDVNLRQPTTPVRPPPRRKRGAPRDTSSSAEEPTPPQAPHRGRTARTEARDQNKDLLNAAVQRHFEKIAGIISADRAAFGVDAQGQLLNSKGEPMRHSNYREALQRILQQDVLASGAGGTSPVGTTHLRALLRRNPATKSLLSREALLDSAEGAFIADLITPSRNPVFRPSQWGTRTNRS